jgi:hypothetical protein
VVIARLEHTHFDEPLQKSVCIIVNEINSRDGMREGMLLTLNGMVNSLKDEKIV